MINITLQISLSYYELDSNSTSKKFFRFIFVAVIATGSRLVTEGICPTWFRECVTFRWRCHIWKEVPLQTVYERCRIRKRAIYWYLNRLGLNRFRNLFRFEYFPITTIWLRFRIFCYRLNVRIVRRVGVFVLVQIGCTFVLKNRLHLLGYSYIFHTARVNNDSKDSGLFILDPFYF